MPLNERVGEIFLANGPAQAREAFSTSLERFLVPDIGIDQEELGVVLLVESPHTHEVCHGYPLAGTTATSAGRRVRDKLVEFGQELQLPEQPIGQLVHQEHDAVQRLGIMNVSQLPFQSDAYRPFRNDACAYGCIPREENDCRDHPEWDNYTGHMNTIRGGPAQNRKDPNCQFLDDAIAEDLRGRLEQLHENHPDVLLVRCGGVAQDFYMKACMMDTYLPHPSRNGWQRLGLEEEQCLQNIVAALWPPQDEA